jgi:DHA1 family multidrug resistance protein-like MFS transporter
VKLTARRPPFSAAAWAILLNSAVLNVGFSMLYPLLAVHLTSSLAFTAATVGLVMALRQFFQHGFAPLGGGISDRIGYKETIATGLVVRSLGFLTFGLVGDFPGVMLGALLSAAGGALFESPGRAALTAVTPHEDRQRAYAAFGVAGWVGITKSAD